MEGVLIFEERTENRKGIEKVKWTNVAIAVDLRVAMDFKANILIS
jgi:hypothetical protein